MPDPASEAQPSTANEPTAAIAAKGPPAVGNGAYSRPAMIRSIALAAALAPEFARDRAVGAALWKIARRRPQPNARNDLLWRLSVLPRRIKLDSIQRRDAFRDVFAAFTLPDFKVRVDGNKSWASPESGGTIHFESTLVFEGNVAGPLHRTLHVGQRWAYHDYLKLDERFRSAGTAPAILHQSFAYFDEIGLEYVAVMAALETGPWYWARCGFNFLATSRGPVQQWARIVLAALGSAYDVTKFAHANQFALMGTSPADDVSFADIHGALVARLGLSSAEADDLYRAFDEKARGNGSTMTKPMPLGRAVMLTGPPWEGLLRLNGRDRRIFEDYARYRIGRSRPNP